MQSVPSSNTKQNSCLNMLCSAVIFKAFFFFFWGGGENLGFVGIFHEIFPWYAVNIHSLFL